MGTTINIIAQPILKNKTAPKTILFTDVDIDRVIEMAWEDRTPFDAIEFQFGLRDADVKELMKKNLKIGSYKLWRKRVHNCNTKHVAKRSIEIYRFKCSLQRAITHNKISKRSWKKPL
jgi:uncharacterized protein (TIGR03643 family)